MVKSSYQPFLNLQKEVNAELAARTKIERMKQDEVRSAVCSKRKLPIIGAIAVCAQNGGKLLPKNKKS